MLLHYTLFERIGVIILVLTTFLLRFYYILNIFYFCLLLCFKSLSFILYKQLYGMNFTFNLILVIDRLFHHLKNNHLQVIRRSRIIIA